MPAQEAEAIERAVQCYIDGAKAGDASKLREGFDERGWMFGSLGDHRYDMPLPEYIAMADGQPGDTDGSYKARIVSLEQVGDAATVVLEEEGFWGSVSFTDFFTLAKVEGSWKIVNKTFVHTGGEPPSFE